MFESKRERTRASSANQPGMPEGMVLPWLMTMPSPREDIKIGNTGARWDEKLDTAQPNDVPESPTPATQLMPMPPEFPRTGEEAGLIAPWLSTTPRSDDATNCEKRNPSETDAVLMRLLRIAEQESGNFHATPENSAEGPDAGTPELPLPTTRLELKEEIAHGDTSPHPAETYVASEADVAISAEHESGNSYAAPECAIQKSEGVSDGSEGVSDGSNEWGLLPRANHPMPDDEIASVAQANQLERSWIRAVSLVPDAPNGVVEGFKQRVVAVPTQSSSRKGSLTIVIATIFTASALCIGATGLRPFSNLPRIAEMPPSPASVSPKEEPVGTEVQNVQEGLGRSGTSSQPPILSSPPASSGGAATSVAMQPSPDVSPRSTPAPPTPAPKPKNGSDLEKNSVALAPSEKFARPAQAPQQVGAPLAWQSFEVPEFGTRVQIPAGIFIPAGKPRQGSGQRFERADGRAVLSIYSRPNNIGESPATYLRQNLRVDRSALDYERIARSFFAVSLERDGVILYSRCNFSSRARAAIHCFDLTYPQEEKRSWDAVVTRISLSLRPLEG